MYQTESFKSTEVTVMAYPTWYLPQRDPICLNIYFGVVFVVRLYLKFTNFSVFSSVLGLNPRSRNTQQVFYW
jgi:hypothetical protein